MKTKSSPAKKADTTNGTPTFMTKARERVKAAKKQVKLVKAQLTLARAELKAAKHVRKQSEEAARNEKSKPEGLSKKTTPTAAKATPKRRTPRSRTTARAKSPPQTSVAVAAEGHSESGDSGSRD